MTLFTSETRRLEQRSWSRVIAARALSSPQRSAEKILRASWPSDDRAALIMKAAVSPTSTSDGPLLADQIAVFRSLFPGSALWRLLDNPNALKLDLKGVNTISVPHVGNFPQPVFVGEGQPGPVVQWSMTRAVVGPAKKILVLSAVSEELEAASPQSVAGVIGRVLSDSTGKSIDFIGFDASPGDDIRPPGLLFGVAPTPPAAAAAVLQETIAADMSNLAGTIGNAGIDPSDVQFIAGPREVSLMRSLVNADNAIMSLGVPSKTIIAVAPAGLASGVVGVPEISTSKEAVLHREDASPGEIVSTPGVSASPSTSMFQSFLIAVRVRAECSWAAAPGAAQVVENVNW